MSVKNKEKPQQMVTHMSQLPVTFILSALVQYQLYT